MKRSQREVNKCQMEVGEVKRSKALAAEKSGPEFNPFLVEPVLARLLKLVDSVSELKELRKICQTWDEFSLKELEDRAFNGKVKAIDFYWTDKFNTESEAEANLVQFMGDTSAIPRLFYSFKFNFPGSWAILQNHMGFFSSYPVTFVHLDIPSYLPKEEIHEYFSKFMESDIWRHLKGITISTISQNQIVANFGPVSPSLFAHSSGNMPKMEQMKFKKFDIQVSFPKILEIFKSAFAYGILTSLRLSSLPTANLNFPGLDPSKLTRLEIGQIGGGSGTALNFTSNLINLAGNGMMLKDFGMSIQLPNGSYQFQIDEFIFENLRLICSYLTQFLSSQSCTLETLTFGLVCHLDQVVEGAEMCKIHLPTFEALHTLKLMVDFQLIEGNPKRTHTKLFGMTQSLSGHFPKIVNLTLEKGITLDALGVNPTANDAGKLQLEHFEIIEPSIISSAPESQISAFVSGNCTNLSLMGLDEIPCANLEYLGLDLSKLTQLEIGRTRKSIAALMLTSGLNNLARNGMKLKDFCISIDLTRVGRYESLKDTEFCFEHLRLICSNLTQFLSSQSSTLESLNFTFVCHLKDPVDLKGADIWCKIHLPKFEALHTLKLWVDFQLIETNSERIHTQLFGMTHNLVAHFPKLISLSLYGESSMIALNPVEDEDSQLQLKHLEILQDDYSESNDNPWVWNTSFEGVIGSVEELNCPAKLFYGERLPWGESLRSLRIYGINTRIKILKSFKLDHFKKLEKLFTKYYAIRERQIEFERARSGNGYGTWAINVDDYLNMFKEAIELPLTSITFIGPKMADELKEEFVRYFPFPVEFIS